MGFELTILGANSAKPAHGRNQTAQILVIQNIHFLIDCGEGTQLLLQKYHPKTSKIEHIFISHLHGDHYFGLIGLLSTMHLGRRVKPLSIYGPPELAEIITLQLKASNTTLSYPVEFHKLTMDKPTQIFENEKVTVETIPLSHKIPCNGFLFKEKQKPRRIDKEKLPESFSLVDRIALKNGEDILDDAGNIKFYNKDYTLPPRKSRSYAYCTDTKYKEDIIAQIKGVDLLYHEATFLNDRETRATETFHCTTAQAATIAKKAKVEKLIIGHYSSRYKDLRDFHSQAKAVFENTILAIEGEVTKVVD